jgi:hypothetical protein
MSPDDELTTVTRLIEKPAREPDGGPGSPDRVVEIVDPPESRDTPRGYNRERPFRLSPSP